MFVLSESSKTNRFGVNEALIAIGDLAITISLIDFGYGKDAGLRTAKRQNQLYEEGRSKADGYERPSKHQSGLALDFFAFIDGRASWMPEHLAMVGAAKLQAASMLGFELSWGGLWRSDVEGIYGWDMSHVELIV